jgi:glutamate/tyrosine decarboxylase-like PLP-dependent enzyme
MWINEQSRARRPREFCHGKGSRRDLARMFGWETHLGHLTSGGTMANLEALWMPANPAQPCSASSQAHYTHSRISAVLEAPSKRRRGRSGRMNSMRSRRASKVGASARSSRLLGTTAVGSVDPLPGS